eukprot:scaffold731_cov261-Pinguiococcus_pyrenoidosus.AAC.79
MNRSSRERAVRRGSQRGRRSSPTFTGLTAERADEETSRASQVCNGRLLTIDNMAHAQTSAHEVTPAQRAGAS